MSRRRYLSTDISTDTAVNRLARAAGGDFAVMLYTWMIPHCDDDGIIHGDAEEIILKVIPGRRDKTTKDVIAALTAMQEHGLIEWDENARCVTFPAGSFYKYQTYIKEDRRRAAEQKNAPEAAKNTDNSADQRKTPQNTVSHSPSLSHPVKHSPSVREGARANGVPASNGAHPPARAAPPPRLIAIPDPFRIPDEFWEWAEEHGYKTTWVKERIELYALQYHGSDVRRTAEEWIAKCQKWIMDDATKPTKSMAHR